MAKTHARIEPGDSRSIRYTMHRGLTQEEIVQLDGSISPIRIEQVPGMRMTTAGLSRFLVRACF
jgi:hypothetical protein